MRQTDFRQLKKQIEEDYKQMIEEANRQHIQRLSALETLREISYKPRQRRIKETVTLPEPPNDNSPVLQVITHHGYGSLFATVKKSIGLVPEKFMRKDVVTAMKQTSGVNWNEASVSNCLKQLVKEGIIEELSRGRGSSPSIYKRKDIAIEPVNNNA